MEEGAQSDRALVECSKIHLTVIFSFSQERREMKTVLLNSERFLFFTIILISCRISLSKSSFMAQISGYLHQISGV